MKLPSAILRSIDELCAQTLVPRTRLGGLAEVAARYAVAITPAMADAIDRSDPHDPIARQFVPDARELDQRPEESADPIGDDPFSPVEGVVHRYPDRVLLKVVNVCAVYCRFCFRREMVGPGRGGLSPAALARRSITSRPSADLGSHPSAAAIRSCCRRGGIKRCGCGARSHRPRQVIRVHTRIPAVAPERINAALVARAARRQGDVRGAACQSSARIDAASPRRLRTADRCRHSDARPVGAVARGQ